MQVLVFRALRQWRQIGRPRWPKSAIHVAAMPHPNDQDDKRLILYFVHNPVFANADSPQALQLALERSSS